jgi:hypothetical protein
MIGRRSLGVPGFPKRNKLKDARRLLGWIANAPVVHAPSLILCAGFQYES